MHYIIYNYHQLKSQYNFTKQKLTPYEQIKISKPNTSLLTRTYINPSIPDYTVSCQVSGGGRGGNGIGAAIGALGALFREGTAAAKTAALAEKLANCVL